MTKNRDNFSTRVELLEQMKTSSGDEAPWKEFKKIYWDLIAGWAKMYGCSSAQIRDIFQETMFCLMRDIKDIEKLRGEGGFRHYLRKLVLHYSIDALSRQKTEMSTQLEADTGYASEHKLWKDSVISKALDKAVVDAGETSYHAFCSLDLENMDIETAAEKLDVSSKRISKLRDNFIRILKADCHDFMSSIEEESLIDEIIGSDKEFINAIKKLILEKFDFEETLIRDDLPPVKLIDRINFVNEQIHNNPLKSNNTANLLIIKREKKELPDKGSKNSLETAFKDKLLSSEWVPLNHYQDIGRVDTCRIPLEGEGISRFHASITEKLHGWLLKDEHSTNGVFVNGKKESECFLKNGDIVQISPRYLMIFSQRTLNEYMDMQLNYMRWWSQHFKVPLEQAAWDWVKKGLAVKFAEKYRKQLV